MIFKKKLKNTKEIGAPEKQELSLIMWLALSMGATIGIFVPVYYIVMVLTVETLLVLNALIFRKYLRSRTYIIMLAGVSGILLAQIIARFFF